MNIPSPSPLFSENRGGVDGNIHTNWGLYIYKK